MLVASQVAPGKPKILHCLDKSDESREQTYGAGCHTSIDQLTVGEATTVEFRFTIGEQHVVTGGRLMVVWRWPFDWSDLQSNDAADAGFISTEVALIGDNREEVQLSPKYNWIAGIEPWHHQMQVSVTSGELRSGDRVRVTCANWRAPTCVADRCRFLMLIDHQGNGKRIRLVPTPSFRVTPGQVQRVAAIVDSEAVIGQAADLIVRGDDEWGNPATLPGQIAIEALSSAGEPAEVEAIHIAGPSARPVSRWNVQFNQPGDYRLKITANETDLAAVLSNWVRVHASSPREQLFWGDLHAGQTEIGCGCGSLAEHYDFGRDCAGLKFITHQANDHYVTRDDWLHTREVTEQHYEPGKYVPFLGCEWSPLTKDGGDRNVFYRDDDPVLRRSDRFFIEDPADPEPDIPTADDFHRAFRDRDVLVNIHVGGRMTNLQWYEQQIEKLCETHSTHGTVEWFFLDALERGYQVGLTAGTDGVMGRPGADHPGRRLIRNCRNGLTAIYASELTREAIWDALQRRCCYATTGERIRVWFEAMGQPMGSEATASGPVTTRFEVQGTQPIECVELYRGIHVIHRWNVAAAMKNDSARSFLRVIWGGTERKGTARLQKATWDGSLNVDGGSIHEVSPINFQSMADEVKQLGPRSVQWQSQTAGNATGLTLELTDLEADASLTFSTGPWSGNFLLSDVLQAETSIDAGGVNRFVKIGSAPNPIGTMVCDESFADDSPLTGIQPYWIRVRQIDQSLAWSSPVYVTR